MKNYSDVEWMVEFEKIRTNYKLLPEYEITTAVLFFVSISFVWHLIDYVTDVWVAYDHFENGKSSISR